LEEAIQTKENNELGGRPVWSISFYWAEEKK